MSPRTRVPKPDEAPSAVMPPNTLVSLMGDDAFSQDELYERYGDAATIPQHMLGIIPNSGHYFEIWPPASRVCFTIVPNFLNAPLMLFGLGAPKNLISLAMFASSIGADCSYCIAHTCTFSMRRGVQPEKLTLEAIADRHSPTSKFTSVEAAVIDVAESIGQVPSTLTHEMKQTLIKEIGDAATTEWVVTVVGMMGFLNKSMDALGIPLEVNCYQETRDVLGKAWSPRANAQLLKPDEQPPLPPPATDGVFRYFRMMLQGPGAAAFERKALAGIPDSWTLSSKFLLEHTGYDFPLLQQLQHRRVIRAITAVMRESLNSSTTVVGLKLKVAAAQIFATIAQSKPIQQLTDAIAKHFEVDEAYLALAKSVALDQDPIPLVKTVFSDEDDKTQALLVVAHGSSWSRVRIDESTVALCRDAGVASAAMVEVTVWISVLQMLHRLSVYFLMDEPESAP